MPCTHLGDAIVCAPTSTTMVTVLDCPFCLERTDFVVDCFEWYGPNHTCLACGSVWMDGSILRPPWHDVQWRERNIRKAKERAHADR